MEEAGVVGEVWGRGGRGRRVRCWREGGEAGGYVDWGEGGRVEGGGSDRL